MIRNALDRNDPRNYVSAMFAGSQLIRRRCKNPTAIPKRVLLVTLFTAIAMTLAGCTILSPHISAGDRLEVRFWGPQYGGTQLSVVQPDGTILVGDSSRVQVRRLSVEEAAKAICKVRYHDGSEVRVIDGAKVRKIAPVPAPLVLTVFQRDSSNLVFRITNPTLRTVRLPSAGYAESAWFEVLRTNPVSRIVEPRKAGLGLFLTSDWRYVGTNWFFASEKQWEEHLKIRTLESGDHLEFNHKIDKWAENDFKDTNVTWYFSFHIPQDWAERYRIWESYLEITGFTPELHESQNGRHEK